MSTHTLSVRLENKPGALARVSQLFSRRGYNIQSLAVGPTERPDISRLTLRVDCSEHSLEQIEKQMHKLVNVLRVTELAAGEAVERELVGVPVSASPEEGAALAGRPQHFQLAESLGGVESLIEVPARMTHAATADAPFAAPPNLIRLSVGIESTADLMDDLERALLPAAAPAHG